MSERSGVNDAIAPTNSSKILAEQHNFYINIASTLLFFDMSFSIIDNSYMTFSFLGL